MRDTHGHVPSLRATYTTYIYIYIYTYIHTVYPRFISDGIYEKPRLVVAAEDRNLVRGLGVPTRRMS